MEDVVGAVPMERRNYCMVVGLGLQDNFEKHADNLVHQRKTGISCVVWLLVDGVGVGWE